MPEKYAEEVLSVLSSSKIKESVGKGYNGFDAATIPTSQKWLKAIAALKPITDIRN
jgi:hypothetical protein